MRLLKNLSKDKLAMTSLVVIVIIVAMGIFAPLCAPHDPEEVNMKLRYATSSWSYWLGMIIWADVCYPDSFMEFVPVFYGFWLPY